MNHSYNKMMNYIKNILPIISKLLVGINLSLFIIIFIIKTESSGGIGWFANFSWFSMVNIIIDIALGSAVAWSAFICIWFIFTLLLSFIFFLSLVLNRKKIVSDNRGLDKRRAIDIDELNVQQSQLSTVAAAMNKRVSNKSSDFLSNVKDDREIEADKQDVNQTGKGINDLIKTIPPDVAEKLRDLKTTLEIIETKKK